MFKSNKNRSISHEAQKGPKLLDGVMRICLYNVVSRDM